MQYDTQTMRERDEDYDRFDDGAEGPKSITEVLDAPLSPYTGSEVTRKMVYEQLVELYGEEEAKNYDPYSNALTFAGWLKKGYRVMKGQKALRSITFKEVKDVNGLVVKRYPNELTP